MVGNDRNGKLLRPTPPPPRVVLNSCRRSYPQRWPPPKRIPPRMGTVGFYGSLSHDPRLKVPILRNIVTRAAPSVPPPPPPSQVEFSRRQVLERVDEELAKGNERAALALVKDSQGKPGGLRCFGSARQVRGFASLLICMRANLCPNQSARFIS